MNKCLFYLGLLYMLYTCLACNPFGRKNYYIESDGYSITNEEDALDFLESNTSHHFAEKIDYVRGKQVLPVSENLNWNEIEYDPDQGYFDRETYCDSSLVNLNYLIRYTEEAWKDWEENPLCKGADQFVFRNFLLPYKISKEYPDDWRAYFGADREAFTIRDEILDKIGSYPDSMDISNEVFYRVVADRMEKWLEYDPSFELSYSPSLKELLITGKGGCTKESFLSVYMLRTIGIPATVDIVPIWGSRNSGHSSPVFWSVKEQKMIPPYERDLKYRRPAKVFRYLFEYSDILEGNIERDVIVKVLPFLDNNHLEDVTDEHHITSDIVISRFDPAKDYFIFCYNYGSWQPVYFGRKQKNTVTFSAMGTDILYRIGSLDRDGSFNLISLPFILSKNGERIRLIPKKNQPLSIIVDKTNSGEEAFLKPEHEYVIQYMNLFGNFVNKDTVTCGADSLALFFDVPGNTAYKVEPIIGNRKLSRPFLYEDKALWY